MTWQDTQRAAIARQKAAHAAVRNGTEPVPAADEGPLARYNRAQTLDYLAQLRNSLAAGAYLPSAGENGLTFDPETATRGTLPSKVVEDYEALVAKLTTAGHYTDDELAEADARLADNLEAGVSLDPATAESV